MHSPFLKNAPGQFSHNPPKKTKFFMKTKNSIKKKRSPFYRKIDKKSIKMKHSTCLSMHSCRGTPGSFLT
jgi:hypothetical protein